MQQQDGASGSSVAGDVPVQQDGASVAGDVPVHDGASVAPDDVPVQDGAAIVARDHVPVQEDGAAIVPVGLDVIGIDDVYVRPQDRLRGGERGGKRRYYVRWIDGKRVRTVYQNYKCTRGEALARARAKKAEDCNKVLKA